MADVTVVTELRPSRIGQRFLAKLLDGLIVLPAVIWSAWVVVESRPMAMLFPLAGLAFYLWYDIYLVRHFGGTPGKLLAKLRIAKLDGSPVGYREALLRSSVELMFTVLAQIALLAAILQIPDAEYRRLDLANWVASINQAKPAWAGLTQLSSTLWTLTVLIVLLVNKRRRTLHDFIAGTIVVQR